MYVVSTKLSCISTSPYPRHMRHGIVWVLDGETEFKQRDRLLQNVEGGVLDAVLLQDCDRLLCRAGRTGHRQECPFYWENSVEAQPTCLSSLRAQLGSCLQVCMMAPMWLHACSGTPRRVVPNRAFTTESYWLQGWTRTSSTVALIA